REVAERDEDQARSEHLAHEGRERSTAAHVARELATFPAPASRRNARPDTRAACKSRGPTTPFVRFVWRTGDFVRIARQTPAMSASTTAVTRTRAPFFSGAGVQGNGEKRVYRMSKSRMFTAVVAFALNTTIVGAAIAAAGATIEQVRNGLASATTTP